MSGLKGIGRSNQEFEASKAMTFLRLLPIATSLCFKDPLEEEPIRRHQGHEPVEMGSAQGCFAIRLSFHPHGSYYTEDAATHMPARLFIREPAPDEPKVLLFEAIEFL